MPTHVIILQKIKATTPLAQLFNAYLNGLRTLEVMALPRLSMREAQQAFAAEARGEVPDLSVVEQAQRYFELTVLSNALGNLYWCIEQADELLTKFFAEHRGDLTAFAAANRRRLLNEYGGEDADWYHNGNGAPDAGEGWEVTETTDPTRLAEYSLHQELARFFPDSDCHQEHIGTSAPVDFQHFTCVVEHQTVFAPRKLFAALGGGEIPMYRSDERGRMVPIPIIDHIEQEINQDVANQALTGRFVAVLTAGQQLAEVFATMPCDEPSGYRLLHKGLKQLLSTTPYGSASSQ